MLTQVPAFYKRLVHDYAGEAYLPHAGSFLLEGTVPGRKTLLGIGKKHRREISGNLGGPEIFDYTAGQVDPGEAGIQNSPVAASHHMTFQWECTLRNRHCLSISLQSCSFEHFAVHRCEFPASIHRSIEQKNNLLRRKLPQEPENKLESHRTGLREPKSSGLSGEVPHRPVICLEQRPAFYIAFDRDLDIMAVHYQQFFLPGRTPYPLFPPGESFFPAEYAPMKQMAFEGGQSEPVSDQFERCLARVGPVLEEKKVGRSVEQIPPVQMFPFSWFLVSQRDMKDCGGFVLVAAMLC